MILTQTTIAMGMVGFLGIQASPPEETRMPGEPQTEECVDFTGHWKGTCEFADGSTFDDHSKIVQYGCRRIELEGTKLPIGGYKNEETVYEADKSSHKSSTVTYLSSGNRELHILNNTVFESENHKEELNARAKYRRKGDRLIVTTQMNLENYVCEYDYQGMPEVLQQ